MLIISILILIAIDSLSFITLSKGRIVEGRTSIKVLKIIHLILSLCSWILFIVIAGQGDNFGEIRNMYLLLIMGFVLFSIWLPRVIQISFSNLGYFLGKKYSKIGQIINITGIVLSVAILVAISWGTFIGRYNFKFEEVEISYDNLPTGLEGFKIVHISDMHLSSFYKDEERLLKLMESINRINPDIIVNTGDFVTISWNELAPFTGVLNKAESRYGNYAIPGNHDAGTYHPYYSDADRVRNVEIIDSLLTRSAYKQLKDSNIILNINGSRLKIAGVITLGTIPDIIFGDLDKALGSEKADFTLLLSHDPNHWYNKIKHSNEVDLTLSGHTHGGQFGIRIGKFRWSPASLLYPAWNGLYGGNDNYLYVNRGLGTISLPARIGMPPEVTIITLQSVN